MSEQEKVINLTASNLGYDLGCPRCLWLSAVAGIKQPGGFFSAAIREMEKTQSHYLDTIFSIGLVITVIWNI